MEFDPAAQDLTAMLTCFDPSILEEETVCAEASKKDEVAVRASLINLKVAYETVQLAAKTLTKAGESTKAAADEVRRRGLLVSEVVISNPAEELLMEYI